MKVVILAGGLGSRISEESHLKPKPMIEIGNAPILWHIMKIFSYYGHNEFIICCGYKAQVIKEYFANYYLHRSDITFDFSNNNMMTIHSNVAEPWKVTVVDTGLNTQTGGRLLRVKDYVGSEPFLFTYGDGVSDIDINRLIEFHSGQDNIATITAVQPGGRFGVLDIDDMDNITINRFVEKSKEDGGWINGGFMVMQPEIFGYLKDGDNSILEHEPMEELAKNKKLSAYKYDGFWQCMDTQRDKWLLDERWNSGKAPWKKW